MLKLVIMEGLDDLSNGEPVRHLETKECGHVVGSFVRNGVIWYHVRTLYADTIEEWKASELREAPEIFSLV
jgi:predicted DNA binding protein